MLRLIRRQFGQLTLVSVVGVTNGSIVNINAFLSTRLTRDSWSKERSAYTMRDDNGGEATGTVGLTVVQRQLYNVTAQTLTGIADVSGLTASDRRTAQ